MARSQIIGAAMWAYTAIEINFKKPNCAHDQKCCCHPEYSDDRDCEQKAKTEIYVAIMGKYPRGDT
jgi:hypothetical protein